METNFVVGDRVRLRDDIDNDVARIMRDLNHFVVGETRVVSAVFDHVVAGTQCVYWDDERGVDGMMSCHSVFLTGC